MNDIFDLMDWVVRWRMISPDTSVAVNTIDSMLRKREIPRVGDNRDYIDFWQNIVIAAAEFLEEENV